MVVQTRRKRKRVSYYEADSEDDDIAMEEIDDAMEVVQAKYRGQAENRKKAKSPTKAPFAMIPDELLPQVLSYVGNVRELFHLSKMNKSLRNAISVELVIRAAVFSGNPYSSTLAGLMPELSNQRIRVPSTLRMLRLLNAQSCERGQECFCYNLEEERSGPLVTDVIRPFGFAICTPCVNALSSCWTDCPPCLKSNKVSTHNWSRILCYPQIEQATGEAVGPMVLYRDIKRIQYSYRDKKQREEVLESTIQSSTAQSIATEDKERLERICDSYNEAKSQYHEYVEAKKRMNIEKHEAILANRAARKLELAIPVFRKLESHFAGFKFESFVLNRDWNANTGICNFHNWPSQIALKPLTAAPSTATQKKIFNAAAYAKDLYSQLEEMGFLGDIFPRRLRRWLDTQENIPSHEQALVRYFIEHKTSEDMIRAVEPCEKDTMRRALEAGDRAILVLKRLSAEECREAFANEVVGATQGTSREKRLLLAKHIWTNNNIYRWNALYAFSQVDNYRHKFQMCKSEYSNLLRKILRYKKHPDTKVWANAIHKSGRFSRTLTPGDAIDTLYEGDFGDSSSDATFDLWRQHHTHLVRVAFVSRRSD